MQVKFKGQSQASRMAGARSAFDARLSFERAIIIKGQARCRI